MFYLSSISLFLALIAAVVGFIGIGDGPVTLLQFIFFGLMVLFVICIIRGREEKDSAE